MGVLDRFERRLEELVNRPFTRAFKAEVEPVEIGSALARACDDKAAIVGKGRTLVPNDFVVELGAGDHQRLSTYAEALTTELAGVVRDHAAEQRYSFIGPVTVRLEEVDDLETGMFRVRGDAKAGVVPAYADDTMAARRTGAGSWVEVNGARHHLTRPVTVIGRGSEADLRIDDPGISRHHAEIRVSGDQAEIHDLGSTNGTLVDGSRVRSAGLRDGATIRLGSTTLLFRQPDPDDRNG